MQELPRESLLHGWLAEAVPPVLGVAAQVVARAPLHMIAGDASFRRYYRLELPGRVAIVMDAPPPRENVATFVHVATLMHKAGLRVPTVYVEQREEGFLLLEDFGDAMVRDELASDRGQQLFDWILPTLGAMVECDTQGLPRFDAVMMQRELELFTDWYLARHCGIELSTVQKQRWQAFCECLVEEALAQPQHFVHRDFHSCNLHRIDEGAPGVIDFQDAVLGPASYDLASWLWDRYISWPRDSLELWMEQARPLLAPLLEASYWQQCCDWVGLQRNLKIIGIFSRLNYRDNKPAYLELLPRFASYVRDVLPRYSAFNDVRGDLLNWLAPCGEPK